MTLLQKLKGGHPILLCHFIFYFAVSNSTSIFALFISIKDVVDGFQFHAIYNQNQGPNPTGNISLTLDSKRQLVVLALLVLLSNKKSLEMAHVAKMELGIRNLTHQLGR